MTRDTRIEPPQLDWGAGEQSPAGPRSIFFDDIYFSGDGPAETDHVFLAGNQLRERFETSCDFCIGELGFGTGLNFLCAWNLWRDTQKPEGAHLNFVSVEAYPLSLTEMARAHEAWPELAPLSSALRDGLPPAHHGIHQCRVADDVTLTLIYGDALESLSRCEASIDAWFFDGFSPSKNSAMWTAEVFTACAQLSAPGASFATFTVAGGVRRALEDAGFAWEKRPGFGRKRDMLAGHYDSNEDQRETAIKRAPWFSTTKRSARPATIAIIGGGIAGGALAHALAQKGFTPTVFEADTIASGASGNPAGLIMPRLDLGDTAPAQFFASAYLHALQVLGEIGDEAIFNACGVLLHATNDKDKERHRKLIDSAALPDEYLELRDKGLFFPQAGIVDPPAFVEHLLRKATICIENVSRIRRAGNKWSLTTNKAEHVFDHAIIANAMNALRFEQARSLPLSGSAGQIDYFAHTTPPEIAHAFGPYAAPAPKGGTIIGATYAPINIGAEPRFTPEATQSNIDAIARTLPALAATLQASKSIPRASVRCTTPDRLPIAGAVPDWGFYGGAYDGLRTGRRGDYPPGQAQPGLYILTGLGSRGLVSAHLCAAMIAAEIAGHPSPVSTGVAQALHPARFFIRDLKRTKTER